MQKKILVIDDDKKLDLLLQEYLSRFNFTVHYALTPSEGMQKLRSEDPDLIILDIMLPEIDGFEVCKTIRREFQTPIIMLTARGEVVDRILGLELGADDYLPKPFEPRELVARIQSVLRRKNSNENTHIYHFENLKIDTNRQNVYIDDSLIQLTSAEYKILELFIKNPGKVLSRDRLLDEIRGIEWDIYNRSIDVLISRIRQKLDDNPKNPRFIKTVWGSGYIFIGSDEK